MEGSAMLGRHTTAAVTAFALCGCSFFLLSYLSRNYKVTAVRSSVKPTNASSKFSSAGRRTRKQVRFEEVKDKPNKSGQSKAFLRKSNLKRDDEVTVICCTGERKRRMNIPENWKSLYSGVNRYRSQQATLMMYA
ncbi:hypothetical protein CDL12_09123 [Handroanthus impetiginosus]|uniref:Uncharacterized protein n=1 Tax=Handroanthus impetiginosus TaxID=429701 RepID=A0A2G9HL01_9LAMI|nr:hypothetical protein CDL12_09123 [Handroanthus impetiginosus]